MKFKKAQNAVSTSEDRRLVMAVGFKKKEGQNPALIKVNLSEETIRK